MEKSQEKSAILFFVTMQGYKMVRVISMEK